MHPGSQSSEGLKAFRWRAAACLLDGVVAAGLLGLMSSPLIAQNVVFRQSSAPAGVVSQESYPLLGSQVSTVTAPASTAGNRFTHWTINGSRVNYPSGRGANPVVFTIIDSTEAVAHYLLETDDGDADGIADWYEIYFFGDLTRNLTGDSDADGFTQGVELFRGSDLSKRPRI